MKKIIFCLPMIFLTALMITAVAFAAGSSPDANVAGNSYFTWEFLGTMSGAVATTTLITQFIKVPLDKVWKVPTRFVVYVIALIILFAVEIFTGKLTADRAVLIMLNGIIVTMASMGTYEATRDILALPGMRKLLGTTTSETDNLPKH